MIFQKGEHGFVANTILHATLIWSFRYFKDLLKIQLEYYERVLNLPRSTSNYAVWIETDTRSISLRIFKMVLNCLEKIFNTNEDRYPKTCFERIKFLADCNNEVDDRYHRYHDIWTYQIKTILLKSIRVEGIWNALSVEILRTYRNKLF